MEIELFYAEPVVRKDVVAIAKLIRKFSPNRSFTYDDVVESARQNLIFVARDEEGRIIGVATLVPLILVGTKKGSVEDVMVSKVHRGKGIGKCLLQKLVWYARESGFDKLDLTARPSRGEANNLYTGLGFQLRETNVYRLVL